MTEAGFCCGQIPEQVLRLLRSSGAAGCSCDGLQSVSWWISDCLSAGSWYKEAAVHLLRWSCVSRESTPSVGFLFEWKSELSFVSSLFSDSHFTFQFLGPILLFVHHFDRISGKLCVLFPPAAFRHQLALTLFCDLCSVLSQPATRPSGFCFLVNKLVIISAVFPRSCASVRPCG